MRMSGLPGVTWACLISTSLSLPAHEAVSGVRYTYIQNGMISSWSWPDCMTGTQAILGNIMARKGPNWCTGPDPLHHKMYVAFGWHRVSARLRGHEWNLDWPSWRDIWQPFWDQRGRGAQDLCLTRQDWEKPWSPDNIELITRRAHSQRIRKYHS